MGQPRKGLERIGTETNLVPGFSEGLEGSPGIVRRQTVGEIADGDIAVGVDAMSGIGTAETQGQRVHADGAIGPE
ncbi:hypothetical protein LAL4801_05122 [Roseibium aggregatum]|uniref:Uncharacterized protein n=1 Tax=Roseibium aggregatum TaxID=187304 RepID=A0A0M6YAW9_9HYPH|nr:hypothetical protein LAL4801_05122 [Roseibium aggregatum]